MQSDDNQTGSYDRFTALLFVHFARNFQIIYITFDLVMYRLFVHLLIILKHHMDHRYVRLTEYICYRWLTPGGLPRVERTHHLHHRLYRWGNSL
jgi:hypothetical protein